GEQPMTGEDANVVVGVDGSTSALRATAWAAQTAVRWHRPLLLTSVLDPPTPYGTGIGLRADRFVELETEGREWLDRARAVAERTTVDHHHTEVGTELVVGEVSSVLRERARDAFRVVVGGDRPVGETGTSASTAMALLPHAACPVAVVRWSGRMPNHRNTVRSWSVWTVRRRARRRCSWRSRRRPFSTPFSWPSTPRTRPPDSDFGNEVAVLGVRGRSPIGSRSPSGSRICGRGIR